MLSVQDLEKIGNLFEEKFDKKFGPAFNTAFDTAFDKAFDRKFGPAFDERFDKRIEPFIIAVGRSFNDVYKRLDRIGNKIDNIENILERIQNDNRALRIVVNNHDERITYLEKH